MGSIRVKVGPLPAESARAFLPYARAVLDAISSGRVDAGVRVDGDVVAAFDDYLIAWTEAAADDPFVWEDEADRDLVARLSTAWFELMAAVSGRVTDLGLPVGPPEGEAFYNGLVAAVTDALRGDDLLGEKLQEAWPALGDIVRRDSTAPDRKLRVVVADDARDLRLVLRIALEQDGRFEIVGEASDGAGAVAACTAEHPDVVILDLVMPGTDGWYALEQVVGACPGACVVVLSTLDEVKAAERAEELGAAAYVQKSSSLVELADLIAGIAGVAV